MTVCKGTLGKTIPNFEIATIEVSCRHCPFSLSPFTSDKTLK